jgi:1-deoxy-D-xylulose-5-phosphate reductoisomerase
MTSRDADPTVLSELRATGTEVSVGPDALSDLVRRDDVDLVLSAVVGAAGLPAALASIECGKPLLLANKESLVIAGELLVPLARKRGVPILPIDSEHSAVFQAMQCGRREEIRRVILTASGGPFRNWPLEKMENASPADALNHPTWNMGGKITVDSATMFNKALEVIEAVRLFGLSPKQVEVVIHPESVVHSMVEFVDGSVLAQMSPPDMRMPIQYALTWPERRPGIARRLSFDRAQVFHFEPPDLRRFPALQIGFEVAAHGGTMGAAMNAANEEAVTAFLDGRLPFGMIWRVVERTIARHDARSASNVDELLRADRWARKTAREMISATDIHCMR